MEEKETAQSKQCHYEEAWYKDETELCIDGICMICRDGIWEFSRTETGAYPL